MQIQRPKTDEEIKQEIAALQTIKPRVPRRSQFGDDNHDAIDAQITVLTERMTRDQVRQRFPEDGCDKLFMALIAADWLGGYLAPGDDTPPSQDWPLIEVATA